MATWAATTNPWGGVDLTSKEFAPVFCQGTGFFIFGADPSVALPTTLERQSLLEANGLPLLGTAIWPQLLGQSGSTIQISMGASDTPRGSIDWEGPYDFVIDTDTFVDFAVAGRYLSVKFESIGVAGWSLQSFDVEFEINGGF